MIRRLTALLLALTLSACATPYIQPPLTPPVGFAGPRIEDAPAGRMGAFVVHDGARLPYRLWAPARGEPWAVIVGLHGMNDHSASFRLAGPYWAQRGVATYAYDQRGFGAAPGYGVWAGEAVMTEDLRTVVALVRARHPRAVIAVAGLDQPDQAVAAQGMIDHFEIARLEDVERPARERQQQSAVEREERHGARQVGGRFWALQHGSLTRTATPTAAGGP